MGFEPHSLRTIRIVAFVGVHRQILLAYACQTSKKRSIGPFFHRLQVIRPRSRHAHEGHAIQTPRKAKKKRMRHACVSFSGCGDGI